MTSGPDAEREIVALLDRFDRAFAAGDADALAALFTDDARLLLLHRDAVEGRPAIRELWSTSFDEFDPAAWQAEHRIEALYDDLACTLGTYTETLVERRGPTLVDVWGRVVFFLRRDPADGWRIALAMNSHSRPNVRRTG
jgi:uncharacterized protein (TIGR02246 family)